jgi:ADP-heptose:LPS heptosyltransferase
MNEPQRIACFHLNQVGDLLFSLPALYNIRQRFPNAHIASVARPTCRELLELSGLVDEIIERPRGSFWTDLGVASVLRRKEFDLAVVFSTSLGMNRLALLSGSRRRIGFNRIPTGFFLTRRVPWTSPPSTKNNLRLVEAIGCPVVKSDYVGIIRPRDSDEAGAEELLASVGMADKQFVALGPGTSTGREIKRWSNEGFAEVADCVADKLGIKPVVVGLAGGVEISRLSRNALDLTGNTSLPVLAALLRRARLFIGVDSGVMHLAAAMGVRVVGLFGPSDPEITRPQGEGHAVIQVDLPCRPCLGKTCSLDRICMTQITPEMVFQAAMRVFGE